MSGPATAWRTCRGWSTPRVLRYGTSHSVTRTQATFPNFARSCAPGFRGLPGRWLCGLPCAQNLLRAGLRVGSSKAGGSMLDPQVGGSIDLSPGPVEGGMARDGRRTERERGREARERGEERGGERRREEEREEDDLAETQARKVCAEKSTARGVPQQTLAP
eukprot:3285655-Rhodomonas_salina.2